MVLLMANPRRDNDRKSKTFEKNSTSLNSIAAWIWVLIFFWLPFSTVLPQAKEPDRAFFKVDVVVTPIRESMQRQAGNVGFARSGETFKVVARHTGWVEVADLDGRSEGRRGFLPEQAGTFTHRDGQKPSALPFVIGGIIGLVIGGLATVAVLRWFENRRNRRVTEAMLATARSRRGKRILALLQQWPEVVQTLGGDTRPMLNLLREWGYTITGVGTPEEVVSKARSFQPNVLMALSKDAKRLEELLGQDAALANTPVIYLGEKPPRLSEGHSVRLHWMLGGNDKSLTETLTTALRRSPKSIRHGVRSEGMRGELTGGGLWEVLHFLAILHKSGSLHIETANLKGEVRLSRGEILFARMGDLADAEAVATMLDLEEGKFSFVEMRGPSQGKGLNTEKLLLDWAKQRDEIHDGHGS
jgi:Domain of unknown function (DUF4388)